MKEKLTRLQNALATIETKGQHTLTMADCLKFLSQLIAEQEEKAEAEK